MTIIRLEKEQTTSLHNNLQNLYYQFNESLDSIIKDCHSMNWEGRSRDEFIGNLFTLQKLQQSTLEQLENLANALKHEINQWEQADAHFGDHYISHLSEHNLAGALKFGIFSNLNLGFLFPNIVMNLVSGKANLNNTFSYFQEADEVKNLINQATEANIRFQLIDENGIVVDEFGAENGTLIPVKWVSADSMPGALGGYNGGPPPTINLSEELQNATQFDLQGVLAHEMQHAIDYYSGNVDRNLVDLPYNQLNEILPTISKDNLSSYDWSNLENKFSASCMDRLKTEINAHSRGYTLDPKIESGQSKVNMDGVFTPDEFKFVLNEREYRRIYEGNIVDSFKEMGFDADVNIWWDSDNNKVSVDIIDVRQIEYSRDVYYA